MRRAYWGDLLLPTEMRAIVPALNRGTLQTFQGVDRDRALIVASSPGISFSVDVSCFWEPESDFEKKGFRAREQAVHDALVARAYTPATLSWIESDEPARTVGGVAGLTITCASHGLSTGDRVLIRRSGLGLSSVCTIAVLTSNTFAITTPSHSVQNGDNILRIEAYWPGCVFAAMAPMEPQEHGDYYSEAVSYTFSTSGSLTYRRTSITLA